MHRQTRIHHRPVGGKELAYRQVLGEHFRRESRGLENHALLEPFVVVGVEFRIGRELADSVKLQPLLRERLIESVHLRIGEHPRQVLAEDF